MPHTPPSEVLPFCGYVETTADALRLIQAARCGLIPRITRRLNELERRAMIKSGAVFVFSVEESGIKRWTDGYTWTPSRISGNFLVYREVVERINRGVYQSHCSPDIQKAESHGALKVQGLIKKTITVKIGGSDHHLICYFTNDDVRSGRLQRPTNVPALMALEIPHELVQSTNFRYPPKLEIGPDGRLTRIRDSDEGSHLSESPSPIESMHRKPRGITSEDSSDFSQAHPTATDAAFASQYATSSLGLHSPMTSAVAMQSSRDYYAHDIDQTGSPTSSSPQWPSNYFQYQSSPSPDNVPHQYSHHVSVPPTSPSGSSRWDIDNLGVSHIRGDLSPSSRMHSERQGSGSGWPTGGRAAVEQPLASEQLMHTSSASSMPTLRTRHSVKPQTGSSAWGWEDHPVQQGFLASSHRAHSQRGAHRIAGHYSPQLR